MLKEFLNNSYLFGGNAPFIEELYEKYLANPQSVPEEWRDYFDRMQVLPGSSDKDVAHAPVVESFVQRAKAGQFTQNRTMAVEPVTPERLQVAALLLVTAYRIAGSRWATVDPLKRMPRPHIPELEPAYYDLKESDLDQVVNSGSFVGLERVSLRTLVQALRDTYCRNIGFEYMFISERAQRQWIQERIEPLRGAPKVTAEEQKLLLRKLTEAEHLERYLHTRYVGQKRFSLEGGESLIPSIDELIQRAGGAGVQEIVIGMAHRGRLNVLVNVLGKMPKDLFQEFEGKAAQELPSGDVKYHNGFSSDITTRGGPVHLSLAFNPSHLEIVNPVVEGSVRARQRRRNDKTGDEVLPILVHGDAAFAAQGVVMETLNLSGTRGYGTGGTVHLIVNNQIGFTTSDPRDARSTIYCTDVAKMVEAPIFHVNGDDPEAVLFVTRLALDFRQTFHKDVVIDIVCFRKLGHNEQDEPAVTQPLMYKKISQHPGTRKLYADKLIAQKIIEEAEPENLIKKYRETLEAGQQSVSPVLSNFKSQVRRRLGAVPRREVDRRRGHECAPGRTKTSCGPRHHGSGRVHGAPDGGAGDRGAQADGRGQGAGRLGHGRDPGLCLPAFERLRRAALRPGLRARHLRAPPRGIARPVPRALGPGHLRPAAERRQGPGRLRGHRLGAFRRGGARLRVRLLHRRAQRARHLGSPVRRLRERRAGGDGSVHQLGRDQVGPRVRPGPAPAARLRGAGARALVGAPRALPPAVRRAQHAGLRAEQRGAGVPPPAAPDAAPVPQAAGRDDAEVAAAQEGGGFIDPGARQRFLPDRDPGHDHGRPQGREAHHRVQRQGVLRPGLQKNRAAEERYGDHSRRAALSVPAQAVRGAK